MSTARCATCSSLRPPNASYCPSCGSPFSGNVRQRSASPDVAAGNADRGQEPSVALGPGPTSVDFSLWTGVKPGAGFALGAVFVSLTDPADLEKRTLTNLYNQRPTWLEHAHAELDSAVFAYGLPADSPDLEVLETLLSLNSQRHARDIRAGEVA